MSDQMLRVRRRKVANVLKGEPWVYPNAILEAPDEACLVRIVTDDDQFLGWGDFNPSAPVRARILSRKEVWPGDNLYIAQSIEAAISRRLRLGMSVQGGAYRLVNSEGDSMPGLVIDQFAHSIVIDIYSIGMLKRLPLIQNILKQILDDSLQYVRFSEDSAKREGGEAIIIQEEALIRFSENGVFYELDLQQSQKTGYFLD
ncbi:MAG: hypothetical protein HRU15_17580, partial [Planctomycetes bacterium]|nr:hypothetical protein [Planctomycetota bacterium]